MEKAKKEEKSYIVWLFRLPVQTYRNFTHLQIGIVNYGTTFISSHYLFGITKTSNLVYS